MEDYENIIKRYPNLHSVMLGRGAVANPALFREIKGGKKISTHEMVEFSHILKDKYLSLLSSDKFTMHKLKEIWLFMMWNYPQEERVMKIVRRTESLSEIIRAIESLPEINGF